MSSRFLITPTFDIFKMGKLMKGLRDNIVYGTKEWGTKQMGDKTTINLRNDSLIKSVVSIHVW